MEAIQIPFLLAAFTPLKCLWFFLEPGGFPFLMCIAKNKVAAAPSVGRYPQLCAGQVSVLTLK